MPLIGSKRATNQLELHVEESIGTILWQAKSFLDNDSISHWLIVLDNTGQQDAIFATQIGAEGNDLNDVVNGRAPLAQYLPITLNWFMLVMVRDSEFAIGLTGPR